MTVIGDGLLMETNRKKVLVFDSHINEREMISDMLFQFGYHATQAGSKSDCYSEIHHHSYRLVLFDHDIPELDINEFIEQIENIDLRLPIAMMGTLSSGFYENKYSCSGIDFLLFKPFGLEQMMRLIGEAEILFEKRKAIQVSKQQGLFPARCK